jgi:hypothetical protein
VKVCLVSNDLLLIYSFKIPFNNGIAGNQYSVSNNGPRNQVPQNLMQNGLKERSVQQKSENYHTKNGNCEEPRQNGEQSGIKSEAPEQEGSLNGGKLNIRSDHGSDNTDGKRSSKTEIAVNKANAKYPGNENDLKNQDIKNQISPKSHASNGELLELYIYKEMTVYVPCI